MAAIIFAIGMVIARLSTLMTIADDVRRNALAKAFIEHKIFSNEFIFQSLFFHLPRIFNDTTVELKNMFESAMFHPGACFFTPYTARTIHDNIFFFTLN